MFHEWGEGMAFQQVQIQFLPEEPRLKHFSLISNVSYVGSLFHRLPAPPHEAFQSAHL